MPTSIKSVMDDLDREECALLVSEIATGFNTTVEDIENDISNILFFTDPEELYKWMFIEEDNESLAIHIMKNASVEDLSRTKCENVLEFVCISSPYVIEVTDGYVYYNQERK